MQLPTFLQILFFGFITALIIWCVCSVYDGLKAMRADRLQERENEAARRRRETQMCLVKMSAVERENQHARQTSRAA